MFRVIGPDNATLDFIEYAPGSAAGAGARQVPRCAPLVHAPLARRHLHQGPRIGEAVLPGQARVRSAAATCPAAAASTSRRPAPIATPRPSFRRSIRTIRRRGRNSIVRSWAPFSTWRSRSRDMRAIRDAAQERGRLSDLQVRAHVGNNRHWLMHLFDPDGSRTEVMETAVQDTLHADDGDGARSRQSRRRSCPPHQVKFPGHRQRQNHQPRRRRSRRQNRRQRPAERRRPLRRRDADRFQRSRGMGSMFDGATLKGWDGPTDLWHVENGAIVVRSKTRAADRVRRICCGRAESRRISSSSSR